MNKKAATTIKAIIDKSPAKIPPTMLPLPAECDDVIWSSSVKRRGSDRMLAPKQQKI
jgi:hypothetical protein